MMMKRRKEDTEIAALREHARALERERDDLRQRLEQAVVDHDRLAAAQQGQPSQQQPSPALRARRSVDLPRGVVPVRLASMRANSSGLGTTTSTATSSSVPQRPPSPQSLQSSPVRPSSPMNEEGGTAALRLRVVELEAALQTRDEQHAEHARQARAQLADTQRLLAEARDRESQATEQLKMRTREAGVAAARFSQQIDELQRRVQRAASRERAEDFLARAERAAAAVREAFATPLASTLAMSTTSTKTTEALLLETEKQLVTARKELCMASLRYAAALGPMTGDGKKSPPLEQLQQQLQQQQQQSTEALHAELVAAQAATDALKTELTRLAHSVWLQTRRLVALCNNSSPNATTETPPAVAEEALLSLQTAVDAITSAVSKPPPASMHQQQSSLIERVEAMAEARPIATEIIADAEQALCDAMARVSAVEILLERQSSLLRHKQVQALTATDTK